MAAGQELRGEVEGLQKGWTRMDGQEFEKSENENAGQEEGTIE